MQIKKGFSNRSKRIYMTEGEFFYGLSIRKRVRMYGDLGIRHLWKPDVDADKVITNLDRYVNRWTRQGPVKNKKYRPQN